MLLPQLLRHLRSGAGLSVDLSSLAIPPMALSVLLAAPVAILCEKLYLSCSPQPCMTSGFQILLSR